MTNFVRTFSSQKGKFHCIRTALHVQRGGGGRGGGRGGEEGRERGRGEGSGRGGDIVDRCYTIAVASFLASTKIELLQNHVGKS